jgi:hypothetical protein
MATPFADGRALPLVIIKVLENKPERFFALPAEVASFAVAARMTTGQTPGVGAL